MSINVGANREKLLQVLLAPKVTEKTTRLKLNNQYTFKVRTDADKLDVAAAVSKLFNVEVVAVRVCNVQGKTRKFGNIAGKRKDWKKAYVTLKEGHVIKSE